MNPRVRIASVASVFPRKIRTSNELEKTINAQSKGVTVPAGIIEILTGVKERRVADDATNASDLATQAARKALKAAEMKPEDIDCLIFAAASGDMMEPATANVVQENLKLSCPVFDVKNACNSFINGIEVAESLIISGKYKRILIVNGEIPSRGIRTKVKDREQLRRSFAGYTLGDAGAAMILVPTKGKSGILYSDFISYGQYWRKSTLPGGGTRFPRDMDKTYFEGETAGLKDIFISFGPKHVQKTLKAVGWTLQDVDKIVVHQVSLKTFDALVKEAQLPREKLVIVLPKFGNMVSASIPVALDQLQQKRQVHAGDKILLIGLAAGVSIGTMALIW